MRIRPMKQEEHNYSYSQSQQISMQTGFIGYLRADMGTDGNSFFSSWNEFRKDLKTDEFKKEFDSIINSLRDDEDHDSPSFLKSRKHLRTFYYDHPEARFDESETVKDMEYFGARVDTDKYAYLMRLTPRKGEYNMYCYCYRRDWLDSHLKKAQRGIRFIDSHYNEQFRIKDGEAITVKYKDGKSEDYTCRYIDDYHLEIGRNLYHICEWAEICERNGYTCEPIRSSLPDQCYVYVQTEHKIGIVKKGETGYYKTDILESNNIKSHDEAKAFVDELNENLGVTKAQARAMMAGSMFGWHTPAADPKSYYDNGNPVKPKHKDRDSR